MTCRQSVLPVDYRRFVLISLFATALMVGCATPGGSGIVRAVPAGGAETVCSGKVVGADGQAVAGATVTAWMGERTYREVPGNMRRVARAVSDADGSWRLRLPPAGDRVMVALVATKGGLAIGWAYRGGDAADALTIRMGAPATLAGTVADEKGTPVAGATVRLILRPVSDGDGSGWLDLRGSKDLLTRQTDAKGRFAFDDVPADHNGLFMVRAAGHGRLNTMMTMDRDGISPPRKDIELVLPAAARIEVQAVEKDTGKAVSTVALVAENWRVMFPMAGEAVKGKPGVFLFDGLPTGRYEIKVADPAGGLAEWTATPARVIVEGGQTIRDVKIELVRGGVAEIRIIDAGTGQGIPNGYVGISGEGRRRWSGQGVDGNGLARVRMAPGEYRIRRASATGYARYREDEDFTIETGKTVKIEISLTPIPKYNGIVTGPTGKPVAGASVCVLPDYRYVKVGDDGKFAISKETSRWPKRKSFLLIARLPGANLAGSVRVGLPGEVVPVKLSPAVTITGRVTDPAGEPVRGADVRVQAGRWDVEDLPAMGLTRTGPEGRYRIRALPAGLDYTVRIRANRRMPVDVYAGKAAKPGGRIQAPTAVMPSVDRNAPAPSVRLVPMPQIPDADAIWGAVANDRRGHIWIGITMSDKLERPSAHLVEYDPATDKAVDRGDAITQLKRAGVYREGEGQLKIHSRIVETDDGYLYFVSMDEKGEDMEKEVLPKWGSHLWRIRPDGKNWEHLLTVPEGLMTLAAGKRYVYALGYYRHMLYRYDTVTGKTRSVEVGAIDGHISRNIFTDRRDHVYVPRVAIDPAGGHPICSLVEYDTSLTEVAATRLKDYFDGRAFHGHGIIGFTKLPDGSIAFVSHEGQLTMVTPSATGPAKVEAMGWLHPKGPAYTGSLHSDKAGRTLYSCVSGGWRGRHDWVTYDLKTRSATVAPFRVTDPPTMSLGGASLYGSDTLDAKGNFYIVGRRSLGRRQGNDTVVFQVKPARSGR